MARNSFFIFHDQEKQENNWNHIMSKKMVVGVCWQAWQNHCGSGGSKLRSAVEEFLREERAARVTVKWLAAGWQRYIYQRRTQSVTRASVELLEMAEAAGCGQGLDRSTACSGAGCGQPLGEE